MPTLDVRGIVVNSQLTINYHSSRVPNDVQIRRLAEVVDLARACLELALRTLRRTNTPPYDPEPIIRRILESHFRFSPITRGSTKDWSGDLGPIISNFESIWMGLRARITISDAYSVYLSRALRLRGYTMTKPNHLTGVARPESYGSIHLDFELLKNERERLLMVAILIHEAAHKFRSMWDTRYRNEPGYSNLSPISMRMNPDSYAFTAISIYKRQCITQLWGHPSARRV
jgi:hypothetical protein